MGERKMKEKKEKNPKSLKIGSLFAWQSRAVSHGICMMILGYLSIYCTDTLKMDPYLVGMLLVLSKLLDGVTDVFAGYLVDRTNTKIGRERHYQYCILIIKNKIFLNMINKQKISLKK